MFWRYSSSCSSEIETVLAKEGVTLQEVMDSEDTINYCKGQHKQLIDFLIKPEVIEELVTLTTKEPSIELPEMTRFKYPNLASEILTCDVPAINERLAGDERLLEKLYAFLENEPPLNPLLASYFSKIMGCLIAKTEQNWLSYQLTCLQVLDFLKARDTFLPLLLKHLGTSAIMDLMLKLMTQVEGGMMRQNISKWLDSQRIIQQLICLLSPSVEKERHDNVAQLLCDFLRIARDMQRNSTERIDPDPLLDTLESPDAVRLLLDQMFDNEKCESSIVGGISVLLTLIDVDPMKPELLITAKMLNIDVSNLNEEVVDTEYRQRIKRTTTDAIVTRMKGFHDLLLNPPKQSSVLTTIGTLDPPVGHTRLQVVRLLATLISINHADLNCELITLGTFPVLLDLFFKYPWNNFLHTLVENCINTVLQVGGESLDENEGLSPLSRHLITNCDLVERILKAWKDNDQQQSDGKALRQGYMGHLISLLGSIIASDRHLKELKLETAAALEEFKQTTYANVIEQQAKLLGGVHPSSLREIDEDLDIPFPQISVLQQQSFTQYQMQNLPSQYMDGYGGFNDDAFNDGDDTLQTIDNPSDINFDLSESDAMQRDAIFKQVCAQSINTLFDPDDQVFEERDHTFQTVIEKKDQGDVAEGSSDSDDESPSDNMDIDPWSCKADPWSALATSTSGNLPLATGWADFSSASFPEQSTFTASFPPLSPEMSPEERSEPAQETKSLVSVPDNLEVSGEQSVSKAKDESAKATVECAASGDHSDEKDKTEEGEGIDNEAQPSMSLEGDSCKPANKLVEKSPDKLLEELQDKV